MRARFFNSLFRDFAIGLPLDITFIVKYLDYTPTSEKTQGAKPEEEIAMSPKKGTRIAAKESTGFTAEEKAAMKARAQELKGEARASKSREEGEKAVLAAIKQMKEHDRSMAKRIHEIITATAPELMPKTWYGMPAYANADGKVICFYQAASKFKVRYATFAFQHDANLDDGHMWPTGFALLKLTDTEEKRIVALVMKSLS
jgi:uncharacterized protein YdhG (YjbR/CyaY superfamily)